MEAGPLNKSRVLETGSTRGSALMAGVLLHGRERTAEEMIGVANNLNVDGIRWIAPAAATGSWYPKRFMDDVELNEPFLTSATAQCDQAVDEASEGGRLAANRILIVGFSQGACIALEYLLRYPGRCAAVIAFTGCLVRPPGDRDWPGSPEKLAGTRVLLTGSDTDEWVPSEETYETARLLARFGAEVELRVYKGRPHVVSEEEIDEARAFIRSCLPAGL